MKISEFCWEDIAPVFAILATENNGAWTYEQLEHSLKLENVICYVAKNDDKVLGFVAGAAIAMLLIWGVLTVIIALDTAATPWITPAINLIDSSVLTKFLYNNNYLYIFISKVTNLQQLMADFMGKFNFS